jgi:hypothetical protein
MSYSHHTGPRWSNVAASSHEGFVELESYAGRSSTKSHRAAEREDVVSYWREAGPSLWFAKDPTFDRQFRERFLRLHEEAVQGPHSGWLATASGALGLVLLLDQFPRNAFRGTPRMYRTDAMARETAAAAIGAGLDRASMPRCGSSSVCRLAIRKIWTTRNARSR